MQKRGSTTQIQSSQRAEPNPFETEPSQPKKRRVRPGQAQTGRAGPNQAWPEASQDRAELVQTDPSGDRPNNLIDSVRLKSFLNIFRKVNGPIATKCLFREKAPRATIHHESDATLIRYFHKPLEKRACMYFEITLRERGKWWLMLDFCLAFL